jgi:ryanodine receptor 2
LCYKNYQPKGSVDNFSTLLLSAAPAEDLGARQLAAMAAAEKLAQSKTAKAEPSPFAAIDFGAYAKRIVSFLARNFFTMKFIALAIAFSINFMLLFYKVGKNSKLFVLLQL